MPMRALQTGSVPLAMRRIGKCLDTGAVGAGVCAADFLLGVVAGGVCPIPGADRRSEKAQVTSKPEELRAGNRNVNMHDLLTRKQRPVANGKQYKCRRPGKQRAAG